MRRLSFRLKQDRSKKLSQALDKLRGEIDTIAPHDCTSLKFEILEQVQVRKLLNNRSVIILDDTFKVSNTTRPIIKSDGYLVISDIFSGCDVKHIFLSYNKT